MGTISLDGKEYDADTISEQAKQLVQTLQFVDAEIARLQRSVIVHQTARNTYVNALQAELAKTSK